ncbi:atrial natriuretic peptide receptor 1-like [Tubulanus polymorphus]|uniref:atrial natriuretic peptide receptor 1-like n=1 Tax=Tubulanus polymorphus TaxID=672921 RepID=UPI003DA6A902
MHSFEGSMSNDHVRCMLPSQRFTTVGRYRGTVVAIKPFQLDAMILTKQDQIELKMMRDTSHENMNTFIGACVQPEKQCLLYQYCTKGSLQDVLENDDIQLDSVFKGSLINDLANGLHYLHGSGLKAHGHLKSSNCVIDSRWMLKITDYGLARLRNNGRENNGDEQFRDLWWTAPETLRQSNFPTSTCINVGYQMGDIYSYGIILFEIIFRQEPYSTDSTLGPKEIIDLIKKNASASPYRPVVALQEEDKSEMFSIAKLMAMCWAEYPDSRPNIDGIKRKLREIFKGRKMNIMDNMLSMMEKYANNLEELVEHRTVELVAEKKKTDSLLYRMLPRSVAEKLKSGQNVQPEMFDNVTVYFSDIVGFTQISAQSQPIQVVDLLNDLYTMFDGVIEKFDVYKVETIGDAYMVVSGLPRRNGNFHAAAIADMALNLLSMVLTFRIRHMPRVQLQVRIGLHTGPCCAGVVGHSMPRYCLFGDTVNTASRMESTGAALRIHISSYTRAALVKLGGYVIQERGKMEIKGKGQMETYWLMNKENFGKSLPTFNDKQV